MYNPLSFKEEDPGVLYELIEKYNFGILFSQHKSKPEATHLPFLLDRNANGQPARLLAHFAKANNHWQHIEEQKELLVVFRGPHAYISPAWYSKKETVPTWNYAAIHVYGKPVLIHDTEELKTMSDRLTRFHEQQVDSDWPYEQYHDYRDRLLSAIVGIEIEITHMEGKLKFNQNRSREDQEGVIAALDQTGNEAARKVSEIMKKNLGNND